MPAFESIVNEGDFVAEHFLTSDGKASFAAHVAARAKGWKDAETSPLTRFAAARTVLESAFLALNERPDDAEASRALSDRLLDVLGYVGAGYERTEGPNATRISSPGLTGAAPLAIVTARPADALEDLRDKSRPGLWESFELVDGTESTSLPAFVSSHFAGTDAPTFVLVLAGRWALLTEAARWAEGRFLAVDVQLVAERNDAKRGGETETALAILAADSLAPDADGDLWWSSVLEDSVKHTVGVSKDLREGVRLSIEIIANDVVTRRAQLGLDPLPQSEAQTLAKQSLRYLYRILFLLYAEASPELGVLPTGTQEYDAGYSLDRLRELVLQDITSHDAERKTHLYDSLAVLFVLVDRGHTPPGTSGAHTSDSLIFRSLSADLFQPSAISHIAETKLSDSALKDVLERLLLSKKQAKRERGFISYAELGINQLGAVYEGLMSYTGFFAEEDLYEVAKNGDSSKGSWVVPTHRADGIAKADFVTEEDPDTGEDKPVLHKAGTFVYRLAGRERQQSASFYTPEVLTRFTVRQALEELLDQDGETTTAEQVLDLSVCEPALGSGAFAIEATRQLAEEYLKRRQRELGEKIPPEDYQRELQRVKAYIALHNVYGVDLNGTAVELAEISLWLDTMVEGLQAPWFGLHLRRGNSLIGARRATYTRDAVNSRTWLTTPPTNRPVAELLENAAAGTVAGEVSGQIFHFLLPAEGWGAGADAKEAKALAPDATKALKDWRKSIRRKPTKKQLDDLQELTYRVEALWQMSAKRLLIANEQVRRDLDVWGRDRTAADAVVTRTQIEGFLADEDSAYRRLRTVMDAWCALWFWPVEADSAPPTLDEWIETCFHILGRAPEARSRSRLSADTLASSDDWDELGDAERTDLGLAGAISTSHARERHPWLDVPRGQSESQGFFHWNLEFPQVFERGGFDLQVGNPPWVRPRSDVDALLAEGDPWWQLANKPSEAERAAKREPTLEIDGVRELVIAGTAEVSSVAAYLGAPVNYPILAGLQPDLYRCFMWQTWQHMQARATVGLIHPESHFTANKAGALRSTTYGRLRRHWHFLNALMLFEVTDKASFGVHVYGDPKTVGFKSAAYLYSPDTVERSFDHDGSGTEPGLKNEDGHWDVRPHASRILRVTRDELRTWHQVLESEEVPLAQTRMLYTVNRSVARVLDKLAGAPRIGDLNLEYSRGWDESIDRKKGYFVKEWGAPDTWHDVILQGPNFTLLNPFSKSPNATMKHNQDWTAIDLEALAAEYVPVTSYKPAGSRERYDADYTRWGRSAPESARNFYRVAWRNMAAAANERTLIGSVLPPGAAHVHPVFSAGSAALTEREVLAISAALGTLLNDFSVRAAPQNIGASTVNRLARLADERLVTPLVARAARLTCLSVAYSSLWERAMPDAPHWTPASPARLARERRMLQVEIDALFALGLGVTADELCAVYRTQFAVLRKHDMEDLYDTHGRLVPKEVASLYRKKGETLTIDDRTVTHPGSGIDYTYEFPFEVLDREADMRAAYAVFKEKFGDEL
ncbi:Eco57I restriction-modification methylase domain-containing protein [Demequina sediminicola]|uniref:Eco57I restriction-modification methylase domain-containing protein n=1 Tax=Demequina sediminicola TaxID=1095026 RepID=UPI0007828DB6|nr:restriction endonuclease subunit M [Demequina sediminicola]